MFCASSMEKDSTNSLKLMTALRVFSLRHKPIKQNKKLQGLKYVTGMDTNLKKEVGLRKKAYE